MDALEPVLGDFSRHIAHFLALNAGLHTDGGNLISYCEDQIELDFVDLLQPSTTRGDSEVVEVEVNAGKVDLDVAKLADR